VAEEVRKLAEESQTAAATIGSLIGEIQAETARAVALVETGAERSDDGAATAAAQETRASTQEIASSAHALSAQAERLEGLIGRFTLA
jgi:methyl-accepting chemotaxis protein